MGAEEVVSAELVAALLGAAVGAILTGVFGYLQSCWARGSQALAERDRQRLILVREIVRYRLDQERVIGPLNEIPLVFGDDDDALRLYRATLDAANVEDRTRSLTDLINRLALIVGLLPGVQVSDIQRGFQYGG